ncbi:MAG: hypothetical protein ACREFY_06890 [Acetobacteraceae bacterium]
MPGGEPEAGFGQHDRLKGGKVATLRFGLRLVAFITALMTLPLSVPAQQAPAHSQPLQSMNIPLPHGPFASWPPEKRQPALRGLRSRCMFVAGMVFDNYQGPPKAAGLDMIAIMSICVARSMPDDWPEQAAERKRSVSFYEAAKRLDRNVPNPSLLAKAFGHSP